MMQEYDFSVTYIYDKNKDGAITTMSETKESTKELVEKMMSRDLFKMWEAGWEIHSLSQNPERVRELLPYKSQMEDAAKEIYIDKSAKYAIAEYNSTKNAVASAFKVLEDYENGIGCPCQLLDENSNPKQLEADGYISILEVKDSGYAWPAHEYFIAKCNRCGQKYRVEENEYHYTWWQWITM